LVANAVYVARAGITEILLVLKPFVHVDEFLNFKLESNTWTVVLQSDRITTYWVDCELVGLAPAWSISDETKNRCGI
jgi:hypothetical protein